MTDTSQTVAPASKERLRTLRKTVEYFAYRFQREGGASGETIAELTEAAAVLQALETAHETGCGDEPSVMGAAFYPAPMPTVLDAIEAHIRQIQQLCDASNHDPTQWLNDHTAQGEARPQQTIQDIGWWQCPCCRNYYTPERLVCPVSGDNRPTLKAAEPHKRVWTGPGHLEETGYIDPTPEKSHDTP